MDKLDWHKNRFDGFTSYAGPFTFHLFPGKAGWVKVVCHYNIMSHSLNIRGMDNAKEWCYQFAVTETRKLLHELGYSGDE